MPSRRPKSDRLRPDNAPRAPWPLVLLAAALLLSGCGAPNQANILLRKQNQDLHQTITRLERTHAADRAKIRGLESSATTLPTLPPDRLDQLYTVHGLRIGRLTGPADLDPNKPGDDGLKIYVVPTDQDGEDLKAAGSFVIEAFDLARADKQGGQKIGQWDFSLEQARKDWYGPLLYSYVLPCAWQTIPRHSRVTITITFTDALTGRVFQTQRVVAVTPE